MFMTVKILGPPILSPPRRPSPTTTTTTSTTKLPEEFVPWSWMENGLSNLKAGNEKSEMLQSEPTTQQPMVFIIEDDGTEIFINGEDLLAVTTETAESYYDTTGDETNSENVYDSPEEFTYETGYGNEGLMIVTPQQNKPITSTTTKSSKTLTSVMVNINQPKSCMNTFCKVFENITSQIYT